MRRKRLKAERTAELPHPGRKHGGAGSKRAVMKTEPVTLDPREINDPPETLGPRGGKRRGR